MRSPLTALQGWRGSKDAALSDEALKNKSFLVSVYKDRRASITGQMKTFAQIRKELKHEDEKLTLLKIDCEGCEYGILADLSDVAEGGGSLPDQIIVEFHFQATLGIASSQDLRHISKAMSFLK